MLKFDGEELKNRLKISERKRIQLQNKLAQKTVDDEVSLWSMVDLMTLLLIFFLLMYSLTAKKMSSASSDSVKYRPVVQGEKPPSNQSVQTMKSFDEILSVQTNNLSVTEEYNNLSASSDSVKYRLLVNSEKPPSYQPSRTIKPYNKIYPAQTHSPTVPKKSNSLETSVEKLKQDVLNAVDESGKGVFSVRSDQHRIVLVLGERITFRVGEASLLEVYHPIFKRIANFIFSKPGHRVEVSGHTDDTPILTARFPSNLELSVARATNVADFLIKNNVSPERISVQGFSQYRPLFENNTKENRQANRRVEIALIKE